MATCSEDKSVRIWDYENAQLDICETFQEQAHCVAFHPSGFHIVVGFADRIRMMNVLQHQLDPFKELPIKNCREIQFSHGGHLFAATNSNQINVYNFYTGDNPQDMSFVEHKGKVQSISWFEDDSGFVSAGMDQMIYVWDLKNSGNPIYQFENTGTSFTCVVKDPSPLRSVYAVGADKTLREISFEEPEQKNKGGEVGMGLSQEQRKKTVQQALEKKRFVSNIKFAQLCALKDGQGLIVGSADNDRPGMITIFNTQTMERIF